MDDALELGNVTFDEKMIVRRTTEEVKIPYTYVCGCGFAGYFVGNLSQFGPYFLLRKKCKYLGMET